MDPILDQALSRKELCMVCMAGCMRGTIAYALILRAVPPEDEQSHVDRIMVTTVCLRWEETMDVYVFFNLKKRKWDET